MKYHARFIAALLMFVIIAALFSGCDGKKGREYIIYISEREPFCFKDAKTGELVGLDLELLEAISEDQGFRYSIKTVKADELKNAAVGGQADGLMAGLEMSHELSEVLDFSKSYFDNGLVLVIGSESKIEGPNDLAGKKIACIADSEAAKYAESVSGEYKFSIENFESYTDIYTAITADSVSGFFGEREYFGWAIKKGELEIKMVGKPINAKPFGFAVKKGTNADLLEQFNNGLANIKTSGVYTEIMGKYGY